MKLKRLWIDGFKNLNDFELDFSDKDGITVLIGNNGSGKSNVLEAISAIFTGLYKMSTPQRKPKFEYEIEYKLRENESYHLSLKRDNNELKYEFKKNGNMFLVKDMKEKPSNYLPSKIILSYSGEEDRIWQLYYKHLHNDFIKEIKKSTSLSLPVERLFDVDGAYWNESLLVFLYSELENNKNFIKDKLGIKSIENIEIDFNANIYNRIPTNSITDFIKVLNPNLEDKIYITIDTLHKLNIGYENELFVKLVASTTSELISKLEINFNNGLKTEDLSEGQKKQILIRAILEFITDENSLVLFDEPDSHIHVANKGDIKVLLDEYPNRETILTTHSPTLMHKFQNHLVYLENGEVKGAEKVEILKEISGDLMSFSEQQIILNSNRDILLVEGKTDIEYIQIALDKLKDDYSELNFDFIPVGGTDSLQHFLDKFEPKENQTIIAILDRDDAGKKALKQVFGEERDILAFNYEKKNNMYVLVYPITDGWIEKNFLVEDYFGKDIIDEFAKEIIDKYKNSFKSYPNIAKQIKQGLSTRCKNFEVEKFNGFRKLFDIIQEIKGL